MKTPMSDEMLENATKYVTDHVEPYCEIALEAMRHFADKGAKVIGYGRTRVVFEFDDENVVKIPFTGEGYMASGYEVKSSNYYKENPVDAYIPTADCRFETIAIGDSEIDVLVMERVTHARLGYKDLPDWVMSVDCGQVGYNSRGVLVAYDL